MWCFLSSISIMLSSPGKNDVTYESIERVVVGQDLTWLHFSFPCNFSAERQIRYARKTKMHDIIFFNFLIISDFCCRLASSSSKYLLWEKYFNYPLTTMQGDHFASCENIVSWSQTSSLPPPPPPLFGSNFLKAKLVTLTRKR